MILSRTLAKSRIARGVRPGWAAAWGPVMFDAACLAVLLGVLFGPFERATETLNFPLWATIVALFALAFIPIQAVLIFSSLWAAKSRFVDDEGNQS